MAHCRFGLDPIPGLRAALHRHRLLGASFADWMGLSHARDGIDPGPGPVSLALTGLIAVFAVCLTAHPAGEDMNSELAVEAVR